MWIESDRHHRERRPRLTARFAWLQDDLWQLHITHYIEDSPLSDMTVELLEGQGIVFKPDSRGFTYRQCTAGKLCAQSSQACSARTCFRARV